MPPSRRQAGRRPQPTAVATRLHSAAIHLLRRLRVADAASGLSAPRASALSVIVFAGPVSLSALAAAEQVRPPTMSRLVAELVRAGLVEQARDPRDLRTQRIRATPKGRALLLAGRARRVRVLAADLERLSPTQFRRLATAVEVLERLARPVGYPPPVAPRRRR